jgi:hypothetical protein
MQYFYEEQFYRVEQKGECDTVPFGDLLTTLYDMIRPEKDYQWTIKDFTNNKHFAPIFFNSLVNIQKFLIHEMRDPYFSRSSDVEKNNELSDWDKFVHSQYTKLTEDDEQEDVRFCFNLLRRTCLIMMRQILMI